MSLLKAGAKAYPLAHPLAHALSASLGTSSRIEENIMNEQARPKPKFLPARRLTLLGSVAGLAIAVVAAGPVSHINLPFTNAPAIAAEAAAQPSGFADLVAKVKPAVISVRVKLNEASTASDQKALPFQPGSPLEKFFRQFGMPGAGDGQKPRMLTGEGSGFFISP